jgi:hypothetical protein
MCRNIRTLYNYDPPVSPEEIRAASLQFVRKISGYKSPSKANEIVFGEAVEEIAKISEILLSSLVTSAPHRNREDDLAKAREKALKRYGPG